MSIDAISLIRKHGVVLESAKGPVPNLADAVTGAPISGNWWNYPDGKQIFRATRLARDSEQVLVCRLVEARITYVHRRSWPALVRLAKLRQNYKHFRETGPSRARSDPLLEI